MKKEVQVRSVRTTKKTIVTEDRMTVIDSEVEQAIVTGMLEQDLIEADLHVEMTAELKTVETEETIVRANRTTEVKEESLVDRLNNHS